MFNFSLIVFKYVIREKEKGGKLGEKEKKEKEWDREEKEIEV